MRYLNRLAWAAVVIGVTATSGAAHQGTVITGGGQTGGTVGGAGGLAGGGGGQVGGGGLGGGQGGGLGQGGQQGTQLVQMEGAPQIAPPSSSAGGSGLNGSNNFASFYANPYH